MDREKLDWAEDILRESHNEHALRAAYEYLSYELDNNPDREVHERISGIVGYTEERGFG
jgi:hypothetical protein